MYRISRLPDFSCYLILPRTPYTPLLNIFRYPKFNKSHYSPSDIFYLYSKSAKTYFRTYAHSYCITVSTRTINLPPCPTMNADTASSLVSRHNNLRSWRQLFMFPTRDGLVDLSLAIGKKAATPKMSLIINPTIIQIGRNAAPSIGLIRQYILALRMKRN